jgi:hypothetical protein
MLLGREPSGSDPVAHARTAISGADARRLRSWPTRWESRPR